MNIEKKKKLLKAQNNYFLLKISIQFFNNKTLMIFVKISYFNFNIFLYRRFKTFNITRLIKKCLSRCKVKYLKQEDEVFTKRRKKN